jgi:hypothetical protein
MLQRHATTRPIHRIQMLSDEAPQFANIGFL